MAKQGWSQLTGKGSLGCAGLFGVLAIVTLILRFFGINPAPPKAAQSEQVASRQTQPATAPSSAHSVAPATHVIPYSLVGTYHLYGNVWRDVVITGRPTDAELIALANALHGRFANTRFALFDDATQISDCNWNSVHFAEHLVGAVLNGYTSTTTG